MRTAWARSISVVGLCLTVGLSGCGVIPTGSRSGSQTARQDSTKKITSLSGKIQFTVPEDWNTAKDLNSEADLQVAKPADELYTIVLTDRKADFKEEDNLSLSRHSELTRAAIVENIQDPEVSPPRKLTINGHPALRYEIKGKLEGIGVTYLHTTVETESNFHQILAWTMTSKFDENGPELEKVIKSFQEI